MPDAKASTYSLQATPDATTSVLALHGGTPANFRLDSAGMNRLVNIVGIEMSTKTTSYTLALVDAGTVVEYNSASGGNITVPPNSSVAFPIGTTLELYQMAAGQITVVAGGGVTLRTAGTLVSRTQYSVLSLRKRATDEWVVSGDTT